MNGRLLVIGDALLDRDVEGGVERLTSDAHVPILDERASRSRPGGAGLAAALAARNGRPVTLLTALAPDQPGRELARILLEAGVDLIDLGLQGRTPEKIRLLRSGKPLLRLDRGDPAGAVDGAGAATALRAALDEADGVLVSDYGRGVASDVHVRLALAARAEALPLVWDPHPRGEAPLAGATLATPNLAEAVSRARAKPPRDEEGLGKLAARLARRWKVERVGITLGENGAVLAPEARRPWRVRCARERGDSCGARDMFAAEAAARLADRQSCKEAVTSAVAAATRFVADGYVREDRLRFFGQPSHAADASEGSPSPSLAKALELAGRVRRRGGKVIAIGGSFDVLCLGHVRSLEAAARLGDCLIVLLASDRSISGRKGADRPLLGEQERAAMLRALSCVDEVAICEESTPAEALHLLRPEVWAKGEQDLDELPESREVPSWGGRVATLPIPVR
jgi:rfaE bifunctional protein kinase chain/domain/rfaE bifunctional protein nucleotidyltransferase chain/domain